MPRIAEKKRKICMNYNSYITDIVFTYYSPIVGLVDVEVQGARKTGARVLRTTETYRNT